MRPRVNLRMGPTPSGSSSPFFSISKPSQRPQAVQVEPSAISPNTFSGDAALRARTSMRCNFTATSLMYPVVHVRLGTGSDKGTSVTESKQRLLEAAIAHLTEHGVRDVTLRGLAAAIGTSHRMLIYHFGSKDGLLLELVGVVEDRTRAMYARLAAGMEPGVAPTRLAARVWGGRAPPPRLARAPGRGHEPGRPRHGAAAPVLAGGHRAGDAQARTVVVRALR